MTNSSQRRDAFAAYTLMSLKVPNTSEVAVIALWGLFYVDQEMGGAKGIGSPEGKQTHQKEQIEMTHRK